ncbi:MAG: S9 family peptidase [Vicinamibacterales bacterium]|nr:S9 family peptidase [Vicinamibacterales bacterium]
MVGRSRLAFSTLIGLLVLSLAAPATAQSRGLASSDLYNLKAVSGIEMSPDGSRVAYTIQHSDRPGTPYSQVWILNVGGGEPVRLGTEADGASSPRWSPDGQWLAFFGRADQKSGLMIARADGSQVTFLAEVQGTNHPLPSTGERVTWSPDSRQIAFVSATPGPETEDANGDPMVITRYLYKPTASEGLTRFNDNRRVHIFIVNVDTKAVRQLTSGNYYEHSISWSPKGHEIAFVSNREPDPDRFFNYDIFTVAVEGGAIRRLTNTKSAEYRPVWSPDGSTLAYLGTTRDLTSSETTMEDTHVWLIGADGSGRRELGTLDNRQGNPGWTRDGRAVLATVQERGSVRLYQFDLDGAAPRVLVPAADERGRVGSWSVGPDGLLAYTLETPAAPAELFVRRGTAPARALTSVNQALLAGRALAEVESLRFRSAGGLEVEAFLTHPLNVDRARKYPLVAMIKGGPHGQQGPTFNAKAQAYAAHGVASLMVNYRGSTGYGQAFADAIFGDQNGAEAMDVLAGVDAALAAHAWLDADRLGVEGGSYGGQLTNWLITQTGRFKAAIPAAGIANLVSFNYMAYYHDYLAVEFGLLPHQTWPAGARPAAAGDAMHLMDFLWQRSPLRHVANVKTPTMFVHGENDNDVPIAEAEQYYIALMDVGVETVMIRYPREGHGIRETRHVVDVIDRSLAWYDRHFASTGSVRR